MLRTLDSTLRRELANRIRYYNELGIYDFYRREVAIPVAPSGLQQDEMRDEMNVGSALAEEDLVASPRPESRTPEPGHALPTVREDLGDCTRCRLPRQGSKQIVFGVGNPRAKPV